MLAMSLPVLLGFFVSWTYAENHHSDRARDCIGWGGISRPQKTPLRKTSRGHLFSIRTFFFVVPNCDLPGPKRSDYAPGELVKVIGSPRWSQAVPNENYTSG